MDWNQILITFGFMVLAYLIGSILSSYWIAKFFELEDIRKKGSGNAGATNARRVHGNFIGASVFVLDIMKAIWSILIPWLIFGPDEIFLPAVGIGAVIGHIFPIFHKFKGGKGASTMLGISIIMSWPAVIVGFVFFVIVVGKTKKVSIGSLTTPFVVLISYIAFSEIPHYSDLWSNPLFYTYNHWLVAITYLIVIMIVILAHKDNISRLKKGNENTLSNKKISK